MRSYWMRILLGALAVFAIGMIGVTLARQGAHKVNSVVTGSGQLTIPLPFVPFQLDGDRLGTLERLVVNREAPRKVSSLELEVKLADSLVARGLEGCRLTANVENDSGTPGNVKLHPRVDARTFFFCVKNDSAAAALVQYGHVTFHPGDVQVPLLLPAKLVDDLRNGRWSDDDADSTAALAEEQAESLAEANAADAVGERYRRMGDSIQASARRLGDSLRAEGRRRSDSIRAEGRRMADSTRAH
jgi:hypothetical protein